jgi:hypothetical protein
MQKQIYASILFVFLGLFTQAQPTREPFCAHDYFDPNTISISGQLRASPPEAKISYIDNIAVVMEYSSVYDVHPKHDPVKYPNQRAQPASFDFTVILPQLRQAVKAEEYDFVLMYSLQELPGWIHSGGRFFVSAKNIGQPNAQYSTSSKSYPGWTRLRACPHMNDLAFLTKTTEFPPNYNSTLTAFHEMGHYWIMYLNANPSTGPATWDATKHPLGYLAGCCAHWSWNWKKDNQGVWPGIMYSGATDPKFNAFDLYAMGLVDYNEASKSIYTIYENNKPDVTHALKLDHMIEALKLTNDGRYEGDGKRIPALDPAAKDLRVLLVVIKGADESIGSSDLALLRKLAADMPNDWKTATGGRSTLTPKVFSSAVSVKELPQGQFQVSPNPVEARLTLQVQKELPGQQPYQIRICDLQGRILHQGILPSSGSTELDLQYFPAGLYVLHLVNDQYQYSTKLVKK